MTNKLKHFIGNWKMFGDSKSFKIINKINKFSFKTRRQHKKKIIKFIKKDFKKILKTSKEPKVLYGGSVNPENIRLFSSSDEIDGFLIGGASQSSKKFIDIIKNYYK